MNIPAATVDLFSPENADTEFRIDNVHRTAEQLGKLFGVRGPFVLKFVKNTIDTWTFDIDGAPYTIDVATYAGIATGRLQQHELAGQMLVDRMVAMKLCHVVAHLERTASVRAMAMQMEWSRVKRAQGLEARRRQIIAEGGGPASESSEQSGAGAREDVDPAQA